MLPCTDRLQTLTANYNISPFPPATKQANRWRLSSAVSRVGRLKLRPQLLHTGSLADSCTTDINCTILTLPDPLFHLLEFYIHNDAPLSCRLPSRPVSSSLTPPRYIHLQFALTGTLQLSHLHINPSLNVLLHTAVTETPRSDSNYEILAATAYSLPSPASSHRLVIGDPLPLQLSVRWYNSRLLPPSTSKVSGLGRHVYLVNIVYCLLSFATGGAVGLAYWRGWELPRRLKRYNREMAGGEGGKGYAWPGSASTGLGDAFAIGKRD